MSECRFSKRSLGNLKNVHPVLVILFTLALSKIDFAITQGVRGEEEQNRLFKAKKSKVQYPNSKHNKTPSQAVDIVSYVNGKASYHEFEAVRTAIVILELAKEFDIPIRWGGDWDSDGDLSDQTFNDFCHFEIDVEKYRKTRWFQIYGL